MDSSDHLDVTSALLLFYERGNGAHGRGSERPHAERVRDGEKSPRRCFPPGPPAPGPGRPQHPPERRFPAPAQRASGELGAAPSRCPRCPSSSGGSVSPALALGFPPAGPARASPSDPPSLPRRDVSPGASRSSTVVVGSPSPSISNPPVRRRPPHAPATSRTSFQIQFERLCCHPDRFWCLSPPRPSLCRHPLSFLLE